jgi:YidC/Oxa1 family membrane protein insertase
MPVASIRFDESPLQLEKIEIMADQGNGKTNSSQPSQESGLSMEKRLLLAFLLMMAVLFVTPYFFHSPAPPPPATKSKSTPAAKPVTEQPVAKQPPKTEKAPVLPVPGQTSAEKEEAFIVDTDLYHIVFSNRGAVVRSWILKKYKDNTGKPLELVNTTGAEKVGYPFSLQFNKLKPTTDLNEVLYSPKPQEEGLGIDYEFSNGTVFCRKSFRFRRDSYLSQVSSEVIENGKPLPNLMVWRGGFGDRAVPHHEATQHSLYYDVSENKLITNEAKAAKNGPVSVEGNFSFAGIEDRYFAAVFMPFGESSVELRTYDDMVRDPQESEELAHVGAAVGGTGENRFSLFVGPKDLSILRTVNPKLTTLVDFGWFGIIAKPLFLAINWVNNQFVHNYGWSIVLVTIFINFALLPLKFTSLKSMKKMQLLQPQIAAINERYKGISIRDPRKAEQNQEVMELYKKNGVNPLGGCIPMLLQIPFFFAFYKVLSVAIELRGAHWLWVTDLSQPEHLAIRVLPVAMIISQFIMQKMTPSTTADPTQQKMMLLMPLVLGFMFYGVASGLVLYWLTSNLVGIAQQWFFNKTAATPVVVQPPQPKQVRRKKSVRK